MTITEPIWKQMSGIWDYVEWWSIYWQKNKNQIPIIPVVIPMIMFSFPCFWFLYILMLCLSCFLPWWVLTLERILISGMRRTLFTHWTTLPLLCQALLPHELPSDQSFRSWLWNISNTRPTPEMQYKNDSQKVWLNYWSFSF